MRNLLVKNFTVSWEQRTMNLRILRMITLQIELSESVRTDSRRL